MRIELKVITNKLPSDGDDLGDALGEARWPFADCRGCVGACCLAGMVLPLTHQEAENLIAKGGQLQPVDQPVEPLVTKALFRKIRTPRNGYLLEADCPNLTPDGQCGVFDEATPVRPAVCGELKVGGMTCVKAQQKAIDEGRARHEPS